MSKPHREPNRLIHEASPYLQQHIHNPEEWNTKNHGFQVFFCFRYCRAGLRRCSKVAANGPQLSTTDLRGSRIVGSNVEP